MHVFSILYVAPMLLTSMRFSADKLLPQKISLVWSEASYLSCFLVAIRIITSTSIMILWSTAYIPVRLQ